MINVVCVQHGNYLGRGAEYVNKLYDMVIRNLSDKTQGRFICFTDSCNDYNPDIEIRKLPDFLSGWWNKLFLFKNGLFKDGEQVFYIDLDTVIVSGLDEIFKYSGDFAILRDFYRPLGYGSGVMSWKAGKFGYIWDSYEAAGFPSVEGGDQAFIEMMVKTADIWQDMYPKCFVSYKADCKFGLPKSAKIVCFHGEPRPHEVDDEWMQKMWKVGGGSSLELEVVANTALSRIKDNIEYSMLQNLPILEQQFPQHDGVAVIVGGGPSINASVDQIRFLAEQGNTIISLNNSWRWLDKNGIKPDIQVMVDAREENQDFVCTLDGVELWYASQCHPSVIDKAKKLNITLWHNLIVDLMDKFQDRSMFWVGSGSSVGIRSILLMYILGYRKFELYGYDSSYLDDQGHAYEQKLNNGERVIEVEASGRKFKAAPWMVTQTEEFLEVASYLTQQGAEITVHGDGLLQHCASTMLQEVINHGDIVEINGVFWPSDDIICRPSMDATVNDVNTYLKHVDKKRVAVQAGGNVGLFPKELAKHFQLVYSFEPDELNAKCFQLNCKEPNITFCKAALGELSGTIGLAKAQSNCGAHYIEGSGEIPVKTIDSINLDVCDLIQLDIEGYELQALKGAVDTIQKHKPVIIIEDNGLSIRYNVRKGEVGDWLAKFGYQIVDSVHRDVIFKVME